MNPRRPALLLLLLLPALLGGCGAPDPVRLGYIGGISGRNADLGIAGRNGVMLAIEEQNRRGGINGRPVELLIQDDRQDAEVARRAVRDLASAEVEAILGPMTSSMALETLPAANEARILMMGITVTTNELTGRDDHFFRPIASTRQNAHLSARYLLEQRGIRRLTLITDMRNRTYSESWARDFSEEFTRGGGKIVASVPFQSSDDLRFPELARSALREGPEAVTLVTNAMDAALLCQHLRQLRPDLLISSAEWAGTERLIELGGRHVEGVIVPQYYDRSSRDAIYLSFHQAYVGRFGLEPGFPGLMAYNATRIVLHGLEHRHKAETLKGALLRIRRFDLPQQSVEFDGFGDSQSRTHLTVVRGGQFELIR